MLTKAYYETVMITEKKKKKDARKKLPISRVKFTIKDNELTNVILYLNESHFTADNLNLFEIYVSYIKETTLKQSRLPDGVYTGYLYSFKQRISLRNYYKGLVTSLRLQYNGKKNIVNHTIVEAIKEGKVNE